MLFLRGDCFSPGRHSFLLERRRNSPGCRHNLPERRHNSPEWRKFWTNVIIAMDGVPLRRDVLFSAGWRTYVEMATSPPVRRMVLAVIPSHSLGRRHISPHLCSLPLDSPFFLPLASTTILRTVQTLDGSASPEPHLLICHASIASRGSGGQFCPRGFLCCLDISDGFIHILHSDVGRSIPVLSFPVLPNLYGDPFEPVCLDACSCRHP